MNKKKYYRCSSYALALSIVIIGFIFRNKILPSLDKAFCLEYSAENYFNSENIENLIEDYRYLPLVNIDDTEYNRVIMLKSELKEYSDKEWNLLYRALRYFSKPEGTSGMLLDFLDGTAILFPESLKNKVYYGGFDGSDQFRKDTAIDNGKAFKSVCTDIKEIDITLVTDLRAYLLLLKNHNYSVFIGTKMDSSDQITEGIDRAFYDLGLHGLDDHYAEAYAAVLNNGEVVLEKYSDESFRVEGTIETGDDHILGYSINSSVFNWDDWTGICVEDEIFSPGKIGMSILVYDDESNTIIDEVYFDTYNNLSCIREGTL